MASDQLGSPPRDVRPMLAAMRSFLRDLWILASPYWRSEERFKSGILLAAIISLNLTGVGLSVIFNDWNRQFYNALQDKDVAATEFQLLRFVLLSVATILVAVYQTYLRQMLFVRWRRWLTDRYHQELAGASRLLSAAAVQFRGRQSRPKNRRGRRQFRQPDARPVARPSHAIGDPGLVRRHSLESVRDGDGVRRANAGVYALGGADLRGRRYVSGRQNWPAARIFEFSAAAGRGGLSLRAGARARERGRHRSLRRRTPGGARPARAVRGDHRQLVAPDAPAKAAELVLQLVQPTRHRLSLHRRRPSVFLRSDSARRPDANRLRVQHGPDRSVLVRRWPSPRWRSGRRRSTG